MEAAGARPRTSQFAPSQGHMLAASTPVEQRVVQIKQLHEESFLYIDQGLTCDEKGQGEQALTLYTKGLRSIDRALDMADGGEAVFGDQWRSLRGIVRKMRSTKTNTQARVETLISSDASVARAMDDPPPSYEQATTPTTSDVDMALDLQESMLVDDVSTVGDQITLNSMKTLFSIEDGVQIFFITPEGYVSAPSYPNKLTIYRDSDQSLRRNPNNANRKPPAYLKIGDWVYPLVPGCSPVLQAEWGAYVFPDKNASPGSAVGVIIPDTVTESERAKFDRILTTLTSTLLSPQGVTRVREEPCAETLDDEDPYKDRTSRKLSKGLITAAEWLAWGLGKGAEKTGELMKKGSGKLQETLKPEDEESKIDPRLQKGAHYARQATGHAAQATGFLVRKLGEGTAALARGVAPHLREGGEKILPKSFTASDPNGRSRMDDVAEVAASGLKSWATVYVGLEQAAKILAKNLADETVNVVQHKYGGEAGKFTENTVYSVTNTAITIGTATNLGPKAIARRIAKDTGKAVVNDANPDKTEEDKLSPEEKQKIALTGGACVDADSIPEKKNMDDKAASTSSYGTHTERQSPARPHQPPSRPRPYDRQEPLQQTPTQDTRSRDQNHQQPLSTHKHTTV